MDSGFWILSNWGIVCLEEKKGKRKGVKRFNRKGAKVISRRGRKELLILNPLCYLKFDIQDKKG